MKFSSGDRVLLLQARPSVELRDWCQELRDGLLVMLGSDEEVRVARKELADLDNFMATLGTADEIPWQDRFFTQVVGSAEGDRAGREVQRVLASGGQWLNQ